MNSRIANIFILCEDKEQQNLVRRFLLKCGQSDRCFRVSITTGGSGEKFVRDNYASRVKACRASLGKKASAMLVVMADADKESTKRRFDQLAEALSSAGQGPRESSEPIFVLIPKRHVETWIRALLGDPVNEETDYKNPAPSAEQIIKAAAELHSRTHSDGNDTGLPPSLKASIPEWRKIRSPSVL